jgi:hypothetical protein
MTMQTPATPAQPPEAESPTEPGWYPDPERPGYSHYWNGSSWAGGWVLSTAAYAGTPTGSTGTWIVVGLLAAVSLGVGGWALASIYLTPPLWLVLLVIAAGAGAVALFIASALRAKWQFWHMFGLVVGVLVIALMAASAVYLGGVGRAPAQMGLAQQLAERNGFTLLVANDLTLARVNGAVRAVDGGVFLGYREGYTALTEWKDPSPVTVADLNRLTGGEISNQPASAVTKETVQGQPALAASYDFPQQATVLVGQVNGVKIGLHSWGEGYDPVGTPPRDWQDGVAVTSTDLATLANALIPQR